MILFLVVLGHLCLEGGLSHVSDCGGRVGVPDEDPVELLPDEPEEEFLAALDDGVGGVVRGHDRVVVLVDPEEAHEALPVLLRAHVLADRPPRAVSASARLTLRVANLYRTVRLQGVLGLDAVACFVEGGLVSGMFVPLAYILGDDKVGLQADFGAGAEFNGSRCLAE